CWCCRSARPRRRRGGSAPDARCSPAGLRGPGWSRRFQVQHESVRPWFLREAVARPGRGAPRRPPPPSVPRLPGNLRAVPPLPADAPARPRGRRLRLPPSRVLRRLSADRGGVPPAPRR
ncbi:unnamed protein product, partial [Scytosiphon promiscuus]